MILTFVEEQKGEIAEASLEALSAGRELASSLGAPLAAIMIGKDLEQYASSLEEFGSHRALLAEADSYCPPAYARVLAQVVESQGAQVLLAGATARGKDLMGRVAAKLDKGLASNCTEIKVEDGGLKLTRSIWGGAIFAEVELLDQPGLLTLEPHAFPPEPAPHQGMEIERLEVSREEPDLRTVVRELIEASHEGVSLPEAEVVVAGGRGVGDEKGFQLLEELASLFGGAVGATRIAINNGWRPAEEQIGQTGVRIAPKLYFACGVSGAVQHMVGCKDAKAIVAINKDPQAPIFSRADWGIVGDLHQVVPALIEEIKKAK